MIKKPARFIVSVCLFRIPLCYADARYTFETFALFGLDGSFLPPSVLIRLGAATGARPGSGFEQGLYNRAIWGV